ncbi:zincin-like metallopeptidase toxin domain-containing protein [Hymenobacter norwichensis]|uniref:zincin-like metallopeptidase toxin domain-containing protein n=1 Tax=Hymenobacter norwichensis TaxID=223903 RepID=UPI0012F70EF9|nr:zincin-like metallopeptidase toxin domain-containing protein [Hymenobacter norwichensis]
MPVVTPTDFMRFDKEKKLFAERPQSARTGYLGSARLSRIELKNLSQKLAAIKVDLIIDKKGVLPSFARAGFDPALGKMYLRKGATHFEAFHETQHAEQWAALGQAAYQKQSRYEREKYVFDKIVDHQHLFSKSEMVAATKYIESLS